MYRLTRWNGAGEHDQRERVIKVGVGDQVTSREADSARAGHPRRVNVREEREDVRCSKDRCIVRLRER